MILASIPEISLDIIYENSDLHQAFPKKDFKFSSNRGHHNFNLNLAFILLSPIQDFVFEKYDCKEDSIVTLEPGHGEIVIMLPNKVIVIHVKLIIIDI